MSRLFRCALFVTIFLSCVTVQRAQSGLDQRVSELSQKISNGLSENQKRTIAVVEFADLRGRVTDFGRFIAEELITRLYETRKFKVIERQLLNRVIAEQKLSLTGMVDPLSAQKLGKLLGVDAIASGTITDLGTTLRINARLIDTGTAEIFAVASSEIVKDAAVMKLVGADASADQPENLTSDALSSRTEPRQGPSIQKIDSNFFTFELQQCQMSGTSVTCDLMITNKGDDRRIGLGSRTRLFDDQGNAYYAERVRVASTEARNVYQDLVSGIAAKARFTFEGVTVQTRRITLLDISVSPSGVSRGRSFNVQFRDVPLRGRM